MAGQRGADGDIGSFTVADLAHHDYVGVLAHYVPQPRGERQSDRGIHVDLIDAVHLVFNRVLDGDDLLVGKVDALERGIERGRFAAAGWAGHEKNAVRELGVVFHAPEHAVVEPQTQQIVEIARRAVEQAHHNAFAVERGQGRDTQIDFAPQNLKLDAAILRQTPFSNVQLGHQFQARNDGGLQLARWGLLIEQNTVNAVAHAKLFLERLDVDVARPLLDGQADHGVHQPNDRRLARHVAQLLQVLSGLGRIDIRAEWLLLFGLAVVFVDGVENFLLARQRRLHAQPAEAAHRRNGLEIQRVGHGDSHRRIVHCHWKETALPHETRGKVLDFGGHRRRLIERGQRHAELVGERRQDVAHRDEAEVDQNLAQLVAALFLEFK